MTKQVVRFDLSVSTSYSVLSTQYRLLVLTTLVLVANQFFSLPCLAADRPNILWLIGEDFSPHLGCYGEKHVSTPNLDRLAGRVVRYTSFFTTAPVCSASRSAFMTGMY